MAVKTLNGSSGQGEAVQAKELRQSLRERLKTISESCNNCRKCVRECKFLQKYGSPKSIADSERDSYLRLYHLDAEEWPFLDLLKGKISVQLIVGLVLVAVISAIPIYYKKQKVGKGAGSI